MNTQKNNFQALGVAPAFLEILNKYKYFTPTPIQEQSIPIAISGKDIVGIAQTGTGKTLAFGIPMLQRIAQQKGRGVVIVPTRELALQIDQALQQIGRPFGLRTAVLIGGQGMEIQMRQLKAKPHIIIATPGRFNDHLENYALNLSATQILVLDEADRMLDMGFAPQINKIIKHIPKVRQTMLFSATMPPEVFKMASQYMQMPIRIEVAPSGSTAKEVSQEVYFVDARDKIHLLENILSEYRGSILVFTRTKHAAKKLAVMVRRMGHAAAEIHSNRSLSQRRAAMDGFKIGKFRVLVATDIAARGIDVSGIELVLNYDLPEKAEDYVHRIGRTARAGAAGHAISFAMPQQRGDVRSIERVIRMAVPVTPIPTLHRSQAMLDVPFFPERARIIVTPSRPRSAERRTKAKQYFGPGVYEPDASRSPRTAVHRGRFSHPKNRQRTFTPKRYAR